jgi:membrane protein implicated in regulation of membrane protease activity
MHHLLLILPLLGFLLFVFLPWPAALPLYVITLMGSLAIYWKIIQSQRKKPLIGKRAMVGDLALVVSVRDGEIEVDYAGETWHAVSTEPLRPDQQVTINAVKGLTMQVTPLKSGHDEPTA